MPAQDEKQARTLKTERLVHREPLKTLLTWRAPIRPFKRRGREFFTTIGAIVFLLVLILLFLKEWLLIAVIIALMFVSYVMATVEPETVEHQITNRGIITGGRNYHWEEMDRFWISEKLNQKILNVTNLVRLPRILQLLLGEVDEAQVKKILSQYLPAEELEKNWVDKASDWLSRRVPLESAS